jgi:hypothetical protein
MAAIRNLHFAGFILGSSLALPGALVVACSSSSNPGPQQQVYNTPEGGDATSTTADSGTPDTGASSESSTPQDAQGDVVGDAADGGIACTPKLSDAGCWTCPAQTDGSVEYLNQCSGTGVRCVGFSNAVLPGYDASGLPPLN